MDISNSPPLSILRQFHQNKNKNALPFGAETERSLHAIERLIELFAGAGEVGDALRLLLKLAHGKNPTSQEMSLLLMLSAAEAQAKQISGRK